MKKVVTIVQEQGPEVLPLCMTCGEVDSSP